MKKRIFIILLLIFQVVFSQDKIPMNDLENDQWSRTVVIDKFSDNGEWVVLQEVYDIEENKFILINIKTGFQKILPISESFYFTQNGKKLVFKTLKNDLIVLDLKSLKERIVKGVISYDLNFDEKLVGYITLDNNSKSLLVQDIQTGKTKILNDIMDFSFNPVKDGIAVVQKNGNSKEVMLLDNSLKKELEVKVFEEEAILQMDWSKNGESLLLQETKGDNKNLMVYSLHKGLQTLKNSDVNERFHNSGILKKKVFISDKGDQIFFYRGRSQKEALKEFEVWNTEDAWIYPRMKHYEKEIEGLLTLWKPSSGELLAVADSITPTVQFNPNHEYALVSHKLEYEPQYKQYQNVDLYLKDFVTGEKYIVSSLQYNAPNYITLAPNGKFIAFFQNNNWSVFDVQNKKTLKLTHEIPSNFHNIETRFTTDKEPIGKVGWSSDGEYILLQDTFDVWLLKLDGTDKKRITRGKEKSLKYRFYWEILQSSDIVGMAHSKHNGSFEFDLKKGLVLEMIGDDLQTGFGYYNKDGGVKELVYGVQKFTNLFHDPKMKNFVFKKHQFNAPPSIYYKTMGGNEKLLYQSNQELLNYDMGNMEIIWYETFKNKHQKGVLLYPSKFDSSKKYPMITYIYEKGYFILDFYQPPTIINETGLNIPYYLDNDYFIFLPGFDYEIGYPGESALKSVESAVHAVLKNPAIDKEKIALMGHSFGGYETAFIMTRSKLFATGIAGGIVSDFESYYNDVQWNGWDTEQMWRMENHIFRMGKSFYDAKELYRFNSPLEHVESLQNPLLIWVGKHDYNTNWYQSLYLFMAMKRLNKEGQFILMNNEGHSPLRYENQKDLSIEIFNWMEKYLKE